MSNPDVAEAGKATQFGAGNKIQQQGKPWSIRNQLRYLASQKINSKSEKPFEEILGDIQPTGAQLIAARALDKALTGDSKLIDTAIENIDGKLAQTNINADMAAIMRLSEEELDDFIANSDAKASAGSGDYGETAESGSEAPAS